MVLSGLVDPWFLKERGWLSKRAMLHPPIHRVGWPLQLVSDPEPKARRPINRKERENGGQCYPVNFCPHEPLRVSIAVCLVGIPCMATLQWCHLFLVIGEGALPSPSTTNQMGGPTFAYGNALEVWGILSCICTQRGFAFQEFHVGQQPK